VAPGNTVGVRIPDHSVPVELAKALKKPITSTSVNRTGEPPLNDPKTIDKQFSTEIDLIIDAGTLPSSSGSTIYDLTTESVKAVR
jgi:L-threonylcarbamoyladenylate synthase